MKATKDPLMSKASVYFQKLILLLFSFIIISNWIGMIKQIRTSQQNIISMKQLTSAFPHLFYPNYFFEFNTLAERFRQSQPLQKQLYFGNHHHFYSDVLQMATAPTQILPLKEPFPIQFFRIAPKPNFDQTQIDWLNKYKCKIFLDGNYFFIEECHQK
ncbi:hypothetical protein [Leptospira jelokensis]|uniref:hypothetical protein n=1 Tax=Leptospira jelokensis TaxID=2484931 RepID=UPI001090CAF3|nr:hypothetical protein [Leptospira jelokensis]TGL99254.1 hypothetical protein EHQ79_15695 [Leptospira jelokensis]